MGKVLAIKIEAEGKPPVPAYVDDDLLEVDKLVNIDKDGIRWNSYVPHEFVNINDELRIVSSPDGRYRNLKVIREIGSRDPSVEWIKIYGVAYVVKHRVDDLFQLVSFSESEVNKLCNSILKFDLIPSERLFGILNDDDFKKETKKKDGSLTGWISFESDDW